MADSSHEAAKAAPMWTDAQLEEGGGHWAERNQPRQRCNAMSEGHKRHMWGPSARSGPQELNLCCHVVRQCIPCV